MNQDTKIVFIHTGDAWYLSYVLHQAKYACPNSEIVLLGDNAKYSEIQFESLGNLQSDQSDEFRRCYAHMSTNPYHFELFCFLRWFYLFSYMTKYQIQSVLHLDSDVLLYSSIEDIRRAYSDLNGDCALLIPRQDSSSPFGVVSPHVCYWTIDTLGDFCRMIINTFCDQGYLDLYKEKWNWHLTNGVGGGICDMTTLYLFWRANQDRIINIAKPHKGNVFDYNINIAMNYDKDEYVVESGTKKVSFSNGHPFFKANETEKMDRVHALHLQGAAKRNIRNFYTGKSFPGKIYSDSSMLFQSGKSKIRTLFGNLTANMPFLQRGG